MHHANLNIPSFPLYRVSAYPLSAWGGREGEGRQALSTHSNGRSEIGNFGSVEIRFSRMISSFRCLPRLSLEFQLSSMQKLTTQAGQNCQPYNTRVLKRVAGIFFFLIILERRKIQSISFHHFNHFCAIWRNIDRFVDEENYYLRIKQFFWFISFE